MQLQTNERITELHFQGTFTFPNDLNFLARESEYQCFVDLFNQMIENRLKEQQYGMNPDLKAEVSHEIFKPKWTLFGTKHKWVPFLHYLGMPDKLFYFHTKEAAIKETLSKINTKLIEAET